MADRIFEGRTSFEGTDPIASNGHTVTPLFVHVFNLYVSGSSGERVALTVISPRSTQYQFWSQLKSIDYEIIINCRHINESSVYLNEDILVGVSAQTSTGLKFVFFDTNARTHKVITFSGIIANDSVMEYKL